MNLSVGNAFAVVRRKARRASELWQAGGVRAVGRRLKEIARERAEERNYQQWIVRSGNLNDADRNSIRLQIEQFERRPLISVVLPVYDVDEKWLRLCLDSVARQIYENWELCIADDHSPRPHVRRVLEEYAARDSRIKIVFRSENGHISAASNSALELATGEFAVLLDHDDELSEDALFAVAREVVGHPDVQMIYSDEDMIDEHGTRFFPRFKPDFSRELMYSLNLVTHLSAYRTDLLRAIGGFRVGLEGSQDYDLALRVLEKIDESQISHIPRILYHWRAIRGSVAYSIDEKPYAHDRAREAIAQHLARTGRRATVERSNYGLHRVRYKLPEPSPKIRLVVFSLSEQPQIVPSDYPNVENVFVSRGAAKGNLAEAMNEAAAAGDEELICFCDDTLRPVSDDWLGELASFAIQPGVGAVAARMMYPERTISHAGLVVGVGEIFSIANEGASANIAGMMGRSLFPGNFSAVSASCMMIQRKVFEQVNGFDAVNLPRRLFDVDLCLRLREIGLRIVLNPFAEMQQTRTGRLPLLDGQASADEKDHFAKKWSELLAGDPFYNPNLKRSDATFSIDPDARRRSQR